MYEVSEAGQARPGHGAGWEDDLSSVCCRTSPNNLQVIKRASQRVWASPSHRRMDCNKSESEEITYPFVCFSVDNHEDAWSDVIVR